MSDALPDNSRALTKDERERMACAWADFRKHYGVSVNDQIRDREHRAFKAGWESAWLEALNG